MSDTKIFLLVSSSVCHSDEEYSDRTGPAGNYKLVTAFTLSLSVVWKYWRNRKPTGLVYLACCHWTLTVSQSVRTKLVRAWKT